MQIEELIVKSLIGSLSENEKLILQQWLNEDASHQSLFQDICARKDFLDSYRKYRQYDHKSKQAFLKVWNSLNVEVPVVPKRKWYQLKSSWLKVASLIIIPLLLACFLYVKYSNDVILPGESKAFLVLDNGDIKELRNSKEPNWIYMGDAPVARESSGIISYHVPCPFTSDSYNTLSVPKGGEYRIILSDGTTVHLNSQSELKYPVSFKGDKRVVELVGEAYFEVSKDSARAFYVKTNGILIKQFGTEFNVRARTPEKTEIALVKGSIGVQTAESRMQKLVPGQLATYDSRCAKLQIEDKNLLSNIAWHSNRFVFYDESLEELMGELSLWYDVDVEFQDRTAKELHFTGSIHRYDDIAIILKAIEETVNVSFKISGHQIIIDRK